MIVEVVTKRRLVDEIDMIFLLNMVPMRMSIEDRFYMFMRSDNFKKAIKIEQAAITITKCVMDEKIMSVFYPLLGGTFSATIEWLFRAGQQLCLHRATNPKR